MTKKRSDFPSGWDEKRVQELLDHYEHQTDEEAAAEHEAAVSRLSHTRMEVPTDPVPAVREMTESITTKRCFVIGPIGDRHADPGSETREIWEQAVEILEEVIQPACSAFGLRPLRADEISQPGEIPEQIFIHLRDDEVVIADLTGANANVMYELGLRHSTNHLTIQIGERGRLPFDIGAIRTILFKRTAAGLVEARKALSAALSSGLEMGGLPVAATRVWRGDSLVVAPHSACESTPNDDAGYLEKIADMAEGMTNIVGDTNTFTAIMKDINDLITAATEQMTRINQQKGPPAAKVGKQWCAAHPRRP